MRKYLFLEDGPNMAQGTDIAADDAQEIRDAVAGRQVCPFCGAVTEQQDGPCPRCTMDNSASSRQATKSRIGPWYVLQTRNPAAPGMKFDTLLGFVRKGRVKPKSVVRGPTTHQLWRFAAHVKGLSREFGVCYSCGGGIEKAAGLCPHCNRSQDPPLNPDLFLEGQDQPVLAGKLPVYRELEAPMVAEDMVVPPMHPLDQPGAAAASAPAAPDQRTVRKNTDGFLSAQDLAAAFKLDFQPKGQRPAAAAQPPRQRPRGKPRRRRHWGRYVLVLLLLGGLGAAGYELQQDPVLRGRVMTQAADWYHQGSAWVREKWAQLHQPRQTRTPHQAVAPVPAVEAPAKLQTINPSADLPRTGGSVAENARPVARPAQSADKPAPQPSQWDQIYQKPSAAARPPQAPAPLRYRQGSRDDVWALYTSAIDAEAQGDYGTAVKKYEQIKEFAPDLRPRDLDLRLKEAQQQAK